MEKQLMEIRVTAVDLAIRLAQEMKLVMPTTASSMLQDAEEIEKYILGHEAKPDGE